MDFIDKIREISERIPRLRDAGLIKTEEGTKNALVMPFISALGYDVFNPLEVTPELVADVPLKKGEKVDYAILRDGKPIMLFECKNFGTPLFDTPAAQLYRYFSTTDAKFGILTDGVSYHFYTDLDAPNKMDQKPFFIFDLLNISEGAVEELKKFTKSMFDENKIAITAGELKYKGMIRAYLADQLTSPSDEFIRFIVRNSKASKLVTQNVMDTFRPILRDAFRAFVNEQVENRLKSALASQSHAVAEEAKATPAIQPTVKPKVVTTQDETEAFMIIRALLREVIDVRRVTMRDAQSYCAILLDDNNRRPLARLYFGTKTKQIGIFDEQRIEQKFPITDLADIYQHGDKLRLALKRYEQGQDI
jgi:hypothetical protein